MIFALESRNFGIKEGSVEIMASLKILRNLDKNFFMAEPLSDLDELKSTMENSMKSRMILTVMYTQARVCKRLAIIENGKDFLVDRWLRKEGGGGITCIIQDGGWFYQDFKQKVGPTVVKS